jgi:hypothetical protein
MENPQPYLRKPSNTTRRGWVSGWYREVDATALGVKLAVLAAIKIRAKRIVTRFMMLMLLSP